MRDLEKKLMCTTGDMQILHTALRDPINCSCCTFVHILPFVIVVGLDTAYDDMRWINRSE